MSALRPLLMLGAACALGCGIPLKEPAEVLSNTCSVDEECGNDGKCVQERCVSQSAELAGLLLQIDLPTSAPVGAGSSTLLDPAEQGFALAGTEQGGFVVSRDLVVPDLVEVTAVSLVVSPAPAGCVPADDGSLPLSVQFQPAEQPIGLPLVAYSASSTLDDESPETSYQCSLQVPSGRYDIYLQVDRNALDENDPNRDCALPPVLLAGHEIEDGSVTVTASVAAPTTLTGSIAGLNTNLHLTGWTIELVEPGDGQPISTSQAFGELAMPAGGQADATAPSPRSGGPAPDGEGPSPVPDRAFELQFWPELAEHALIRLTPPSGEAAMPTVLWSLEAVDLDGDFHVGLDMSVLAAASPVAIQGTVLAGSDGGGVGALVTIQSEVLLDGLFGANAAYRTTADTDGDGRFTTSLLPGTFDVIAIPGGDASRALTKTSWKINQNDLGGGRTIIANPKTWLQGTVGVSSGLAAFDVPAYLQPSTSPALDYLDEVLATYDVLPGSATAVTGEDGGFVVAVDPGRFDMSVRPDEESGLPWLVRSRIDVEPTEEAATMALGTVTIPNPVVLTGRIRAEDGTALSGAIVRAWYPLPADEDEGASARPTVIQVGRAVSDASGAYQLLLPASVGE